MYVLNCWRSTSRSNDKDKLNFKQIDYVSIYFLSNRDQWNTRSSEDLVYIGTNKEASIKKLMKLEDDPITEEQAADLRRMNQSQCSGLSYEWVIEPCRINQLHK